jgi:diadenosine tetraphosphate (Ap4A) HIT family hydrolase
MTPPSSGLRAADHMDCYACHNNDQFDALPPQERVAADAHWRVAHAFNTALPGWLVLVPRRHVTSVADLTDAEAAVLGSWQVRLSRALRDVTGCVKTYVVQFAEQGGFEHVHFHVVPRMADIPDDRRGPAVFGYLNPPPGQGIDAQQRDELAAALRASLH